eukprot:4571233-Pyramimonas_sp.AAC.1
MSVASSPRPSRTPWHLATPPRPGPGGVGGGVTPYPKGKNQGWKRELSKPPTPRGLVGLFLTLRVSPPAHPGTTPRRVEVSREVREALLGPLMGP